MVNNLPAVQETWVQSQFWKIPWRREREPTPVFLPGEFHGHRNLASYSPRDHNELDKTEQLTHTHACYSKGNIVVLKFLTGAKAPANHFDRYQGFNSEKDRYDLSLQKVTS